MNMRTLGLLGLTVTEGEPRKPGQAHIGGT